MSRKNMITSENLKNVMRGEFCADMFSEAEEIRGIASQQRKNLAEDILKNKTLTMDSNGVISGAGSSLSPETENCTYVKPGVFAVPNADQWYQRNPMLFQAEINAMAKQHPDAQYGFMKSNGDMYWILTLKIGSYCEPYRVMLKYNKDHPNNSTYGGSIKAILLDPSIDILFERAYSSERPGIPHLLGGEGPDSYTYLCTRRSVDVHDGKIMSSSAAQVACWAAEWIANFEIGLEDKRVWNKFCGDHFKDMQVA